MKLHKLTAALVGVAALTLGLAGCGKDSDSGNGSGTTSVEGSGTAGGGSSIVDKAASDKKLTIGVKFDQPGLGLRGADGKMSGFDVEVAKYVAKQLGVDESGITWKETPSAARETALKNKEVDMIVATYSITDKRKAEVSFAGPYFVAHQDLLVKADNTGITGAESLNGKLLCSVKGSTPAQNIKDKYAKEAQLKEYGGYSDCVQALKSGAVDAVTTDDVILAGYAAQYPGEFKVVGKGFTNENYGIGLWKGDTKAQQAVNAAIEKMEKDGDWKKALESTVGPSGYTIPEPPAITEK